MVQSNAINQSIKQAGWPHTIVDCNQAQRRRRRRLFDELENLAVSQPVDVCPVDPNDAVPCSMHHRTSVSTVGGHACETAALRCVWLEP
jgi:hypothetical protein